MHGDPYTFERVPAAAVVERSSQGNQDRYQAT